jgi:CHAT domain-containing protein/Tfp pilus assembly protein PilF
MTCTHRPCHSLIRAAPVVCALLAAVCAVQTNGGITDAHRPAQSAEPQQPSAQNQEGITSLEPDKPLERNLAGGQKHRYQILLDQGQHASLLIGPCGMDVSLRFLGPDGKIEFQSDAQSWEVQKVLELASENAVAFQVEIEPKYPKAPPGKYEIRIADFRPATEKDRQLYDALRLSSQSARLVLAGAYEKAQAVTERALEIRERVLGSAHPEVAVSLNDLGVICTARTRLDKAETLYQRALEINESSFGNDHSSVAEVTDNLAKNFNAKANYAEAERLAKKALSSREKSFGPDHYLVAASLGTLAEIYLAKADYATAQIFSDRALEIAGKSYGPDDLPYADFASRSGRVQVRQGNYSRAEEFFSKSLHTRETNAGKDSLQTADSLYELGWLYFMKVDNVKSEQFYQQALALKERILGPDHLQVGVILGNLGLIFYRRGDFKNAIEFSLRSTAIKEKALGQDHPSNGPTLNTLGLVYWREGNYPKAKEFFQRALNLLEKVYGPDSPEITSELANLGIIAKETGNYDQGEANYKRALKIRESTLGKQHPQVSVIVESLGILYRDKGDYARAEPMFLRAMAITEGSLGSDSPDAARQLKNLEQLYSAEGDPEKALKCLQRIRTIEEKNLPLNLAIGSERQKLAYFDGFRGTLNRIITFQVRQDSNNPQSVDLAATALLQRKGRVLDAMADGLGALRKHSSSDDGVLLDHLSSVTSQLATLVLNGPQKISLAEHHQRVKALTEEREKLENELGRRSAGYYERSDAVTLAAIRAAIPENAALIEFVVFEPYDPKVAYGPDMVKESPRYAAYVIARQGAIRWQDLGTTKEIDASVDALLQALRDPKRNDISQLARAVDGKVLQPFRGVIGDATHLLVSPDGELDLLPFEALLDDQGRFAVERYSISYLTTGRDLLRMQVRRPSKSGPLVIANPFFGEPDATLVASAEQPKPEKNSSRAQRRSITTGADLSSVYFAPLSGTSHEAHGIQSLFPDAQVLTGKEASKAALNKVEAPSILHIATHGFFLQDAVSNADQASAKAGASGKRSVNASPAIENPLLRSGLALSGANLNRESSNDGILTALEASSLNLWGTKLVVLSACDTGVGEVRTGEGVYGLRRAFFLAGTESLVMSLWPVSDYVTRELMTEYYSGLKKGLGRGEALRQAQLTTLKRKGRQHPFYWASFIQSGEWANLDGLR